MMIANNITITKWTFIGKATPKLENTACIPIKFFNWVNFEYDIFPHEGGFPASVARNFANCANEIESHFGFNWPTLSLKTN